MSTRDPILARYEYDSEAPACTSRYLWDPILALCRQFEPTRVLDLGCGNGAFCRRLVDAGYQVVGCDPSADGIRFATTTVPQGTFKTLGVDDDPAELGALNFDVVVSTEVVEHLYLPAHLPRFAFQALRPGGYLVVSTPYHGYLKNLFLSLTNKWDVHHTPFWDGGHIKFWSRKTLGTLLENQGFRVVRFVGAGRLPYLWKSMILVAVKPLA